MAKILGPLMSQSAVGTLAATLTFRGGKDGARCTRYTVPRHTPSNTPAQIAHRSRIAAAVAAWHALTPAERLHWSDVGRDAKTSAYHAFMRHYLAAPPSTAGTIWDGGSTVWDGGLTTWDP